MQWEYNVVSQYAKYTHENCEELNKLGLEGWELVSVVLEGVMMHHYFKRKLS